MSTFGTWRASAGTGLVGAVIAVFGAGPSFAATGIYLNRADFLAANPLVNTETFNAPFLSGVSVDFGDFTATTHPDTLLSPLNGRLHKQGNGGNPHFVTFEFDQPIYAWGIDIFDFGNPTSGELRGSTDTGSIDIQIAQHVSGNTPISLFWGVIDTDGFTSITLSNTTIGDSIQFDDLQYRTVPEPSTALLMLAALGASLFGRRP